MSTRPSGRKATETRSISFERGVICHAEGSCLVTFGKTKVLCTASYEDQVPKFLQNQGRGWLTAQYGMLPRSTHQRMQRESSQGKQSGRTQEIQRLIGRSLRLSLDYNIFKSGQITIDCDVIQADGGTRTAAINGGFVALQDCITLLLEKRILKKNPIINKVAAISCGIYNNTPIVDLDYAEDSCCDVDANFVFTESGNLIEIQSSAEKNPFSKDQFLQMHQLAFDACKEIFQSMPT